MPAPPLSTLLSRDEWRTCFAMQWVASEYGAWGREETGEFESLGAGLRWAITLLWHSGYRFRSLRVDDDGTIFPKQDGELTPGNMLYVQKLANARPVDFKRHVQVAIELFERENLSLSAEPLRQALAEIQWSLDAAEQDMDEDEKREIAEALNRIFADGRDMAEGRGLGNVN